MDSTTRISYSAVTHIGTACTTNDDRIYANGKFTRMNDADSIQISLEDSGSQFLFALADGMTAEESGISIINELKKFQTKSKNSSKNIQVKADELVDNIEQTSNLLHSLSIGEKSLIKHRTAFSGLLIDNGCIVAVNMGASRIYKLDGDNFNLVVNDYKRAERLLKMGIINDEQAELLSGQRKTPGDEEKSTVKRSDIYPLKEGTTYLLCSSGLTESVSEDAIYDIMDSNVESDVIAAQLVDEALKNGSADNISAVVIQIGNAAASAAQAERPAARAEAAKNNMVSINQYARSVRKSGIDVSRLVSVLIVVVIVAAVVFAAFTMWLKLRNPSDDTSTSAATTLAQSASTSDISENGSSDPGDSTSADEATAPADGQTGGQAEPGTKDGQQVSGKTPGTDYTIPAGGTTYTVKKGDKLMKIAKNFYGDESRYKLIMEANNIDNPDKIKVGQVLKIPEP